jgi:hypothetical protein
MNSICTGMEHFLKEDTGYDVMIYYDSALSPPSPTNISLNTSQHVGVYTV